MPLLGFSSLQNFSEASLAVTASNVSGIDSEFAACGSVTTSGTPGTTVTNGSGSYTYLWEQTGTPATSGPYNVNGSTAQNPTWTQTVCDLDADNDENWKVTVTDTVTSETASTTISVTLIWTNLN